MKAAFDKNWLKQALDGQSDAIAQLASQSTEVLFRFCFYRVGGNRHLCEEVVQDTLVTAITKLSQYDPQRASGDILPWLMGLARNEIRRVLAREKLSTSLDAMWSKMDCELRDVFSRIQSESMDDDVLALEQTRQMVNVTMSQLPPNYRSALESKYMDGLSVRQMAAASSMSEKAVESQLSRARRAFRETFLTLTRTLEWGATHT